MVTIDPYAARLQVARLFLEMSRLAGDPGGPLLQRLGCLSQALDDRVDQLAAVRRDRPDERRRLETAPCTVRFTTDTGVPPDVRMMSVERIVAAAAECGREIRRLAGAEQPADLPGDAAARFREQVAMLDDLVAAAVRAGLGDGPPPPPAGEPDLAAATEEVIRTRRALRRRYHAELSGRLEAYRQKAADDGLAERLELEPFYRAARQALDPRAFDLTAAGRAVLAYQRAVNDAVE